MFPVKTAMTLAAVYPKREKREDGTTEKVLVLKVTVEPFTSEMAGELNIKSRLFSAAGGGEAHADVMGAHLAVAPGLQTVAFHRAPDPEMPVSVVLRAVKVEPKLVIRKDKETNLYNATLTLNAHMPDARDVLAFFQGHAEQWFVTFEREQGDMLESAEDVEKKPRRLNRPRTPEQQQELDAASAAVQ
jgi:hypothetical protein